MLAILFKHMSSLTIDLRCFYNALSGPGVDKLLYLAIVLLNSSIKKDTHSDISLDEILFKMLVLI